MKIHYNPRLIPLARKLRKNSTLSEVLLWKHLKQKKMLGYQFLRQKPIGEFIVDFYCHKLHLIIEIDGDSHTEDNFTYDMNRQRWLESKSLNVPRFEDIEVKKDMDNVLIAIEGWIKNHEEQNGMERNK